MDASASSIQLDPPSAEFVANEVAEGRFAHAADVVRAGLELLREENERLAALRAALIEGEESGPPEPFDFDAFIAERRREWAAG